MGREDAENPLGWGCGRLLPVTIALSALPAAPEPPRLLIAKGILTGGDGRAWGYHLVSPKVVPAKGTLGTHGFVAVSRKEE